MCTYPWPSTYLIKCFVSAVAGLKSIQVYFVHSSIAPFITFLSLEAENCITYATSSDDLWTEVHFPNT